MLITDTYIAHMAFRAVKMMQRVATVPFANLSIFMVGDQVDDDEKYDIMVEDKLVLCKFIPACLLYCEITQLYPGVGFQVIKMALSAVVYASADLMDTAREQGAESLFLAERDPELGNAIEFFSTLKV